MKNSEMIFQFLLSTETTEMILHFVVDVCIYYAYPKLRVRKWILIVNFLFYEKNVWFH